MIYHGHSGSRVHVIYACSLCHFPDISIGNQAVQQRKFTTKKYIFFKAQSIWPNHLPLYNNSH